ncbi:hypothetical protein K503DRAFT_846896 [Rhizopogon vinicolor AM-OR11-026]|uniref:Phospholipid/glycerol acyltransferase domain-containing protein n=1 Tax=Rhizopogon vinicolor AM-OR11-026 TaxID=1314800 RepID=A0A1B7NG74_9AGAM|nr:hypothetical protein K503DRAFT_846896 [Rhizopogon vinicolor AM-OR11-026]
MEKFSAFRDPGTGIQPFLAPVPSQESDFFATLLIPVRVIVAVLRVAVVIVLTLLHIVLVHVIGFLCRPFPPLQDLIVWLGTALLARLALYAVGFWWVPTELVVRKRGKFPENKWNPRAGDLIVTNWSSWIEVLWLAYQYNPVFVLPVANAPTVLSSSRDASPISYTPGRRTGTGSAAISSVSRVSSSPEVIRGFRQVSLLEMVSSAGNTPSAPSSASVHSLEDIRHSARRPVVVFPECTTSNGRSLLRFADVFNGANVPVMGYNIFLMCVRYDPPTPSQPSLSHSIPDTTLNPLRHLFKICTSLPPQTITIRQLPLSESPSSQLFMVNEVVPEPRSDVLAEVCAVLIARIGKMKRVGFGWEDKNAFLHFYRGRR